MFSIKALGTHWGAVHVLDFEGNVIKTFRKHSATVTDVSIDDAGEFLASASDDGMHIYTSCETLFKREITSVVE